MKNIFLLTSIFLSVSVWVASAQTTKDTAKAAPAPASPVSMPGMAGPLTINPQPLKAQTGIFGDVYVSGAVSGIAQLQNHVIPGDKKSLTDVSNAQVFIQKVDGIFQFYLQLGGYSLPDIGSPYIRAGVATPNFFGYFPVGYVKIVPASNFYIEAGKLPTVIGAEYIFSFENINIQRGLLWNQENIVARGIQANFTAGPVVFALSYNDGFYSNKYNWITGGITYTINSSNTLAVIGGGNIKHNTASSFATPLYLNNENIYNLLYTYTSGRWTFEPYVQYSEVPANTLIGTTQKASTLGGALLINYTVPPGTKSSVFSIPFRLEYIKSTGSLANGAPNLLYGQGSNAFSATVTPTYQYKRFFTRAEFSYVKAGKSLSGSTFGPLGNDNSQSRALLEIGLLF